MVQTDHGNPEETAEVTVSGSSNDAPSSGF